MMSIIRSFLDFGFVSTGFPWGLAFDIAITFFSSFFMLRTGGASGFFSSVTVTVVGGPAWPEAFALFLLSIALSFLFLWREMKEKLHLAIQHRADTMITTSRAPSIAERTSSLDKLKILLSSHGETAGDF